MAAKKEKKSKKKVKSLPAKTLSIKQAKGVKGGKPMSVSVLRRCGGASSIYRES